MNNQLWVFFSFTIVLGLFGCSSAPSKVKFSVLERYQSVESYGLLSVEMDKATESSASATQFIDWTKNYARGRGIKLATVNQLSKTDSKIIISMNSKNNYSAALFKDDNQLDQLEFNSLSQKNAQLIIDEMLLLWHPPATGREPRVPVPEFALQPTFYEVSTDIFFKSWYVSDSFTPTFTWEAFPREWDIPPGLSREDFKNVRYHFRLGLAHWKVRTGFSAEANFGEEPIVLSQPQYTVEQRLRACRQYMWTVLAVFELNGVPRQTEWAGAFPSYFKPWDTRRKSRLFLGYRQDPSVFFFAIRTPKSPFAVECVY
jgi:hypothetical protein